MDRLARFQECLMIEVRIGQAVEPSEPIDVLAIPRNPRQRRA